MCSFVVPGAGGDATESVCLSQPPSADTHPPKGERWGGASGMCVGAEIPLFPPQLALEDIGHSFTHAKIAEVNPTLSQQV